MPSYESGEETDKWLLKDRRMTTFPIMQEPAQGPDDIIGSAFLILFNGIVYMVSAKHVIDIDSLVIGLPTKDGKVLKLPSTFFEEAGASWIEHPAGLDLVAIPFPDVVLEKLEVRINAEKHWAVQSKIKKDSEIVHLGYPDKDHAKYADGSPSAYPIAMKGEIISLEAPYFTMRTDGARGASGGPVFLRRDPPPPLLIGVAIEGRMRGKRTRPDQVESLYQTKALVISLVKDILELDSMVEQCARLGFPVTVDSDSE